MISKSRNRLWGRKENSARVSVLPTNENYLSWILHNEPSSQELAKQTQTAQTFSYRPLLSILTPIYNVPLSVFQETALSIKSQTYSNWEWCLVDGASTLPELRDAIRELTSQDLRIRATYLDENRGISGNSNVALGMALGEFIVLLDQDDLLAPFALYEIVKKLNENPTWDLLYSDHDLFSSDGNQRHSPLFKPDWSPEIMLSANYITHLTVIRTSLARELGGFDPQMDGAQDWDLFLRISEASTRIAHIPKPLYHWRESNESTAANIWAKPYAPRAQLQAITSHLSRLGHAQARAFFDASGYIRVHWAFPVQHKVSIIIPSRGANDLLEACVDSILNKTSYPNFEILIVNNGPQRMEEFPYYQNITKDARIQVVHYDAPFNYSAVNNFGVKATRGELLLFLNNDTEVLSPDWLDELVMWATRKDVGVVGAKLLSPDGVIQHAGVIIGLTGFAGHIFGGLSENRWSIFGLAEWYRNYTAVTAACMMVRREVFEQIGGFEEEFLLCGNDVALCLRVRDSGLKIVYNPFARLKHWESATHRGQIPVEDFRTSFRFYLPILKSGDPYFNPHLSYWNLMPALATPGEESPLNFAQDYLRKLKGPQ